MKVLILCTGNSCRSQMVEGLLKSFDGRINTNSAGTDPAHEVHPLAVQVMQELDIDISTHKPKLVDQFLSHEFDFVITVCDHAKETCPVFTGKVRQRLHIGFEDPAATTGKPVEVLAEFRRIRDEIRAQFYELYQTTIKGELQ